MDKIKDNKKTKCLLIICWGFFLFTFVFQFINETHREEDNYIYCEILQQNDESNMQVSLPSGKTEWIVRKDEQISEDGKYVLLHIVRYYNRLNQLNAENILETTIRNIK